jgi:hypothetical protein
VVGEAPEQTRKETHQSGETTFFNREAFGPVSRRRNGREMREVRLLVWF